MLITRVRIFAAVMALALVGGGCVSTSRHVFSHQVQRWVVGTSTKDAIGIMQQHGFSCELQPFSPRHWEWWVNFQKTHPREASYDNGWEWHGDIIHCTRHNNFWNAFWLIDLKCQDGKVVSFRRPFISSNPLRINLAD